MKIRALEMLRYVRGYRVQKGAGREQRGTASSHAYTGGVHWRTSNSEFVRRLPTRTCRRRHIQRERQPKSRGSVRTDIAVINPTVVGESVCGNGRGKAQPGSR